MALVQTPSQTVGPFFHCGLVRRGDNLLAREDARGPRIILTGQVRDGEGVALPDALVEIWQADTAGIYAHAGDPRSASADQKFQGFGRSDTAHDGCCYRFETVKPGRVAAGGKSQAPHVCVRIFARGLLTHLETRCYFADEAEANAADPIFLSIDPNRCGTLLATRAGEERGARVYRFDIVLQGVNETVFFEP